MTDQITQVDFFIEKFGSQAKLARALGHKNSTTIQGWRKSGGVVPTKQHDCLYRACVAEEVSFSPADFLVVPELSKMVRDMETANA